MSSPAAVAKANCITCRKVLDASWEFCPACGADNRDPALHHGSVAPHNHDFNFGLYCIHCGHSSGSSTDRVVIANNPGLRVGGAFCIIVGTVFPLCALSLGWFRDPAIPQFVKAYGVAVFALVFGLIGVFMLLANDTTIFDLKARTVTLKRGLILAPKVETLGLDRFSNFKLTSWQPPRQVTPTWYLDLIGRDGRDVRVATYSRESQMRAGVDSLSRGTGLPVDDQSGA